MSKVVSALALLFFAATAGSADSAAKAKSYLCLADQATGFTFDKTTKGWKSTKFNTSNLRWIVKLDPDKNYRVYDHSETGSYDDAIARCGDGGFDEFEILTCDGSTKFVFSASTARFTLAEYHG